jgi:type IV pilus assembly protein PilM
MALPFFDSGAKKKRDQMVSIDLGGRTTKAVHVQRRSDGFALNRYALLDAPIYEKSLSVELLTEHLKAVSQALDARTKSVTLAIGVNESLVRHADMPRMPVDDMRLVLKNNSKNYLQQDLSNHVFDCYIIPTAQALNPAEAAKGPAGAPKQKILIAGAKKQLVEDFVTAIRNAGLVADHILPGLIGPINAFEKASPEIFSREVVALVDIGFKHSSISILAEGELMLSRTVAIGGDRLTSGLAESMNISYAEAEGIKVGMANEVQPTLESLLSPLGRELRASVDFFEHQHDRPITKVFVTGASSQSEFILQSLQNEMMVECKTWNPTTFLQMALPPEQTAEIEQVAPQLTVALGAALTVF